MGKSFYARYIYNVHRVEDGIHSFVVSDIDEAICKF